MLLSEEPKLESRLRPMLRWSDHSGLFIQEGSVPVRVVPCFPWNDPGRFLSIRDLDGNEKFLIEDLENDDRWDQDSKEAVKLALNQSLFAIEVERIIEIEEEIQIRNWKVQTKHSTGSSSWHFQTATDSWPTRLPSGGLLIKSLSGDPVLIRDPSAMDAQSKKFLWALAE